MNNSIYKNLFLPLLLSVLISQSASANETKYSPNDSNEVSFLGVYSTNVSPTLTHQLGFPEGFYLTIQQVEKDSPADEAGLEKHDILQKVDDQIIINAEQLRELIRSKEAGTNVGITYYRGGKEYTTSAKLTTKIIPRTEHMERLHPQFSPPNFMSGRWNNVNSRNQKTFRFDIGESPKSASTQTKTLTITNDQSSVQINDDHGSLALDIKGINGHLTIRGKDGDTLYDGDYKSGEIINSLPEHWQKRLREINTQLEHQNLTDSSTPIETKERKKAKSKKQE